jgi:hypothetical protein
LLVVERKLAEGLTGVPPLPAVGGISAASTGRGKALMCAHAMGVFERKTAEPPPQLLKADARLRADGELSYR